MSEHYLKTVQPWFGRVSAGEKTAEIRKHDRDFQVGDTLVLVEATQVHQHRTAEQVLEAEPEWPTVRVEVTHVLPAAAFDGLADGYCLLSFAHPTTPPLADDTTDEES